MIYNKTKRNLEKAAAIVGIVFAALALVSSVGDIVVAIKLLAVTATNFGVANYAGMLALIAGICSLGTNVALLILCCKAVGSPVKADGTIAKRKGIRIAILVLSVLSGNFITFGLIIAVLCLKDFKTAVKPKETPKPITNHPAEENANAGTSVDDQVAQLKHLRELGLLDDEAYKQAIKNLVVKAFK